MKEAKDVSIDVILATIDRVRAEPGRPAHLREIVDAIGAPEKLVRARLRALIARGVIAGCACGCRGDFER